jgi:hypothetical protein
MLVVPDAGMATLNSAFPTVAVSEEVVSAEVTPPLAIVPPEVIVPLPTTALTVRPDTGFPNTSTALAVSVCVVPAAAVSRPAKEIALAAPAVPFTNTTVE